MSNVIVVGGGAAGMMAAVFAARNGQNVQLLEKNEKLGKKLFITGKGRCNITNAADIEDLFTAVISNPKFLYSGFYSFTNQQVIDFFEELPDYDIALYTHKKMKTDAEKSLALLQEVLPVLEAQEDFSNDALFEMLSAFGKEKGYKTGYIMWPIRTALSGKQMTPAGATEILEVLGKEESLARIDKAIEKLSK